MHLRRYRRPTSDVRQHHQEAGRHSSERSRAGCAGSRSTPKTVWPPSPSNAPGSSVECRIAPAFPSSVTPFGHKFGCAPAEAVDAARPCPRAGTSAGRRVLPCRLATARPGRMGARNTLCRNGLRRTGRPHHHQRRRWFPYRVCNRRTRTRTCGRLHHDRAGTPFRFVVHRNSWWNRDGRSWDRRAPSTARWYRCAPVPTAGAGCISTSVVTADSPKPRMSTSVTGCGPDREGDPVEDAVIAGPTCDGDDVLYERYPLPVTLRAGDRVEIADAGAYTASYASVSFNGFAPLPTHFAGTRPGRRTSSSRWHRGSPARGGSRKSSATCAPNSSIW